MIKIRVEAEVRPTEDLDKVKKAILNVFEPEKMFVVEEALGKKIIAESSTYDSLFKLHGLLRRERILDAARKILKSSVRERIIVFHLHKQAAYRGRLSFIEGLGESPMGPITFIIECGNPKALIDWLTPKTKRGKPLWEIEPPEN